MLPGAELEPGLLPALDPDPGAIVQLQYERLPQGALLAVLACLEGHVTDRPDLDHSTHHAYLFHRVAPAPPLDSVGFRWQRRELASRIDGKRGRRGAKVDLAR